MFLMICDLCGNLNKKGEQNKRFHFIIINCKKKIKENALDKIFQAYANIYFFEIHITQI